jgi:hypothetical protein
LGEDVTETLESIPRQWKVIQHVREKFTCRDCEKISQAPAPFHVIARGWAGPSLLAMILFVVSEEGKEAVVAILQPGSFCGEECLTGHKLRMSTVKTLTDRTLIKMAKASTMRALHDDHAFSELFTRVSDGTQHKDSGRFGRSIA